VVTGRLVCGAALAAWLAWGAAACAPEPVEPIRTEGRLMTVTNTSHDVWLNVEIWLNDHYRVTKSRMPPGERLGIPLDAFVAGFGQRFNAARQVVQGIEVTATTPGGVPVRLVWGRGRRR
jgi:hypothetical protein